MGKCLLFPKVLCLCGFLLISACSPSVQITPTSHVTPTTVENTIAPETATQTQTPDSTGRGSIYGMSVSPDGTALAMSTTRGGWIYSLPDGEVLHHFEGMPLESFFDIPDIAWSPDGTMLAIGKRDNGVWVWNAQSWDLLAERDSVVVLDDSGNIFSVTDDRPGIAWSPDGQYLAVGSGNESVWVWDSTLDTWEDWSHFTSQQIGLTWTEEGQLLMLGGRVTEGGIYDVTTGELVQPIDHWVDGCCGKVSWSPDNSLALIMFDLGGRVVAVQNNEYAFWAGVFPETAWSPSGLYFATSFCCYEQSIKLWVYDTRTYELVIDEAQETEIEALAWTPDDELLVVEDIEGEKVLWNYHTEEVLFSLNDHY